MLNIWRWLSGWRRGNEEAMAVICKKKTSKYEDVVEAKSYVVVRICPVTKSCRRRRSFHVSRYSQTFSNTHSAASPSRSLACEIGRSILSGVQRYKWRVRLKAVCGEEWRICSQKSWCRAKGIERLSSSLTLQVLVRFLTSCLNVNEIFKWMKRWYWASRRWLKSKIDWGDRIWFQ